MTKRGFTLIELMGVIVLLGILGLVVFPAILNQMKKVDTSLSEANRKIVYSAADDYIKDNRNNFQTQIENDSNIVIELDDLVNGGYLSKDIDVKDYRFVEVSVREGVPYNYKLLKNNS
ncbi:MAG: type II secretion system protein [Bacilli bacterium]